MILQTEPPAPITELSPHGAGCRCLLRLLEDEGRPRLPDEVFLQRYLPRFPAWRQRPGATDALGLCELARELQLATGIEISRDFDRVRQAHQSGQAVLVLTERTPVQRAPTEACSPHVTLLTAADAGGFVVWCPFASGASDMLPRADRSWWEHWLAVGLILTKGSA